jgi:hypothetical protein
MLNHPIPVRFDRAPRTNPMGSEPTCEQARRKCPYCDLGILACPRRILRPLDDRGALPARALRE